MSCEDFYRNDHSSPKLETTRYQRTVEWINCIPMQESLSKMLIHTTGMNLKSHGVREGRPHQAPSTYYMIPLIGSLRRGKISRKQNTPSPGGQ